jgi:hypothetical protein
MGPPCVGPSFCFGISRTLKLRSNRAGDDHWTEKLLHSFNDDGLTLDLAGNLYGVTGAGGSAARGRTVVKLS